MTEDADDTGHKVSRREFVKAAGTATLTVSLSTGGGRPCAVAPVSPSTASHAETPVARFYVSLSQTQRERICFPYDHPLRSRVMNHWSIVEPTIGDLTREQRALCREIFSNLCSDEGAEQFDRQMADDYGGFEKYHVAVFGQPGTGQPFEWVLTGRHDTLRADGNKPEGAGFGGPLFYGHGAEQSDNVWSHQSRQAEEIFSTLDDSQRREALVGPDRANEARTIHLRRDGLGSPGLSVAELDDLQKQKVQQLLRDLIRPFRAFDACGVQQCLSTTEGTDNLRMTFYKDRDLRSDRDWHAWKLEGPAFAWHFHGEPHVHAWVNIARKAPESRT